MANGSRKGGWAVWLSWVLVAMLVVVVAILVALAFSRESRSSGERAVRPVPTFSLGRESTSKSTPAPTSVGAPGGAERFLSAGTNTLWRATGGICGSTGPTIESSSDEGKTWTDVTPRYRGIAAVLSIGAFAGTEAEMVASVGAACEAQALRTFTQGQFWDSYPQVLASATYTDPAQPGQVNIAGSRIPAPCSAPYGLRTASDSATVVVLCDGRAFVREAQGGWDDLGISNVKASAVESSSIVVGHLDRSCAGLQLTTLDTGSRAPIETSCLEGADISQPIAIATGSDGLFVWAGASVDAVD